MFINGHKTSCTRTMYLRKKEKKRYIISSLHPSKRNNTLPKSDYSHIQNYSPFLSRVTKGRVSSRHLIGRASISIIIWSIIVITIIIIIILAIRIKNYWMRWWRSRLRSKTTHSCLPSCNMTDMNVHLIQLRRESVQVSIHALQLRHDVS